MVLTRRPLQILDCHLKKTAFGQLFIISTAFGLLINFMMGNLLLLQYSRRPQLAKQSLLYKIFPLFFNVSYFLDNRYRQCQCVYYTHSTHTLGNQINWHCLKMSEYDPYLAIYKRTMEI